MTIHATFPDFRLRELTRADAPAIVARLNDLGVVGWLAVPPFPYRLADADAFFRQGPAGWPHRAAIEVDGALAGIVSVDPHLGYWLAPACHGRGIMSRAAAAIVDAHFAASEAEAIPSGVFEGNAASARVLERLGFRESGRSIEFCRPLGVARPHISYRLARETWRSRADTLLSSAPGEAGEAPRALLSVPLTPAISGEHGRAESAAAES